MKDCYCCYCSLFFCLPVLNTKVAIIVVVVDTVVFLQFVVVAVVLLLLLLLLMLLLLVTVIAAAVVVVGSHYYSTQYCTVHGPRVSRYCSAMAPVRSLRFSFRAGTALPPLVDSARRN